MLCFVFSVGKRMSDARCSVLVIALLLMQGSFLVVVFVRIRFRLLSIQGYLSSMLSHSRDSASMLEDRFRYMQ